MSKNYMGPECHRQPFLPDRWDQSKNSGEFLTLTPAFYRPLAEI